MTSKRTYSGRIALLTLALTLGALSGCAGSAGHSRANYVDDYERGRYGAASAGSIRALRDPSATDRDVARLTAGLSAHAMGRNDEATVWLRTLTTNEDPVIAGKALATLGLIAFEDKEYRSAAPSLSRAAMKLKGNDSARAALYAGDSYAALGSFKEARVQYRVATKAAADPRLRNEIARRLGEGYTLQLGAFASRTNAERSRRQVTQDHSFQSLGAPVVLERINNRGARLYLVQVGRFGSVRDAKAAQIRTGIGGIVTMASVSNHTG